MRFIQCLHKQSYVGKKVMKVAEQRHGPINLDWQLPSKA